MNKILISVLLIVSLAFSSATINVAVIETEIDAGSAAKEIEASELRYITQEIRRLATNSLQKPKYSIMTEQTVQAQGDAVLQECAEENCMVSLGEKIGADYITRGTLSKFRNSYTLTVEIYDTKDGMLVASLDNPVENEDLKGLLNDFREIAPTFFRKLDSVKGNMQAHPVINGGEVLSGSPSNLRISTWAAIGLDVLGAAAIGFGIYHNSQVSSHKKSYDALSRSDSQGDFDSVSKKAEDSKNMRNIGYIAGAALLAGGISIHIFF